MEAEILEALRAAMREDTPPAGLTIIINGPIIITGDPSTLSAIKLILNALKSSRGPDPLKAKAI